MDGNNEIMIDVALMRPLKAISGAGKSFACDYDTLDSEAAAMTQADGRTAAEEHRIS